MKFVIKGGKRLSGEIRINGAKNAALKAMAASVLFETPLNIQNVPAIEDVSRMSEILKDLGIEVESKKNGAMSIDSHGLKVKELKKEIAERLRASIVLAGPLLARNGVVSFPHPGGCVIGKRPIDIFLDGWRAMGAKMTEIGGNGFKISAKKLHGADFIFRGVSVTGTETMMMTAVLAKGRTILRNCAMEPEIPALADFLNKCGAKIKGAGSPTIEIRGRNGKLLRAAGKFRIMPDRIEAGSFLILGAALGKNLKISDCVPEHISSLIVKLKDAGVSLKISRNAIAVTRPKKIKATNIQTREYPGFPTDLQAPFAVLMTQAEGESVIFETIFENRLGYIDNLKRMGADIFFADPQRILIKGPTPLRGREIESPDLRAGLAFIIGALLAKGESSISNVYQIDRGYERIDERLRKLGADIKRVD